MITPTLMILKTLSRWWLALRYHRHFIIADSRDNSITFSRRLWRHICRNSQSDGAKVFVFKIHEGSVCSVVEPSGETPLYGFSINPDIEQETQIADIQYNDKYRSIGFESLCPSVCRILYDYGFPFGKQIRLSVIPRRTPLGSLFYQIMRPRHANP